jgi:hypothetical protein
MNEQKYQRKYPDIAGLLHDTDMTYAEIARLTSAWANSVAQQDRRPLPERLRQRMKH